MTADVHTLTGAYVVGAVSAQERRDVEAHLAECADCAAEVRSLQETAAMLARAAAVPVPPRLREAVMRQVAQTPQLPPQPTGSPDDAARGPGLSVAPAGASAPGGPAPAAPAAGGPPRRPWWRSPAALAAAVLLVACAGLGGVVLDQRADLRDTRQQATAIAEVAADPDRRTVTAEPAGGGRVTLLAADDRGVVVTEGLPALPEDRTYQLWVVADSGIRSAGLLPSGDVERLVDDLGQAAAVAVSVEPAGGSEQPTTTPIAELALA